MLFLAVVIMTINSLIQQAPAIANALVPGSFGISKGVGGAIQEMKQDSKNKAASAAKEIARFAKSGATKNVRTPNVKTPWKD